MSVSTCAHSSFRLPALGSRPSRMAGLSSTSFEPGSLNSGLTTLSVLPAATAKLTSEGGTSMFSNEPDMESLPPMAATPSSTCASSAPSRLAMGRPQRVGSAPRRSKYSWNVR